MTENKRITIPKPRKIISLAVVTILALVFFSSGIGKLVDPDSAMTTLVVAFAISYDSSRVVILLLSNVEIALAVMLVVKRLRPFAMKVVSGMLVMFLVFLVYLKANGIIVDDCGCFGGLVKRTIPEAIVEEIVLIVFSLGYFIMNRKTMEQKKELMFES